MKTICVLITALTLGLAGCADRSTAPTRVVTVATTMNTNRTNPKEVRDFIVENGFAAAANESAGPVVVASPERPARPPANALMGPPIMREAIDAANARNHQTAIRLPGIRSHNPHTSKEAALSDALNVARIELMKHLETLEPPIHARPSLVTMKWEYIKGEPQEVVPTDDEKKALRANGANANVRWMVLDLELNEEQVRNLRSSDRVTDAFRVGAILFALLVAMYGFLRLDQWSKGYLTLWLGIGAAVLVLAVALLVS